MVDRSLTLAILQPPKRLGSFGSEGFATLQLDTPPIHLYLPGNGGMRLTSLLSTVRIYLCGLKNPMLYWMHGIHTTR